MTGETLRDGADLVAEVSGCGLAPAKAAKRKSVKGAERPVERHHAILAPIQPFHRKQPSQPSCRLWWRCWQRETTFGVGRDVASGEAFLSSKQSNTSASVVAWRRRETDSASPIGDPLI